MRGATLEKSARRRDRNDLMAYPARKPMAKIED
jgi:hypothetical protein